MRFTIAVALLLASAGAARAQDVFEIQVYDAETAAPGGVGVETHINYVVDGVRATAAGSELPTHHVGHVTFEPHLGLARWAEAGMYLQTAVLPDGQIDWGGFKVRLKVRWPRKLAGLVGLSLNQEIADVPTRYEASGWGMEVRPIVDVETRRFYASVNPIVAVPLAGPAAGRPDFEPCAKAAVRIAGVLLLGGEYYGALGPIASPRPAAEQVHRVFGVLNWSAASGRSRYAVEAGIGYGLSAGERWIAKAILSVDLEP